MTIPPFLFFSLFWSGLTDKALHKKIVSYSTDNDHKSVSDSRAERTDSRHPVQKLRVNLNMFLKTKSSHPIVSSARALGAFLKDSYLHNKIFPLVGTSLKIMTIKRFHTHWWQNAFLLQILIVLGFVSFAKILYLIARFVSFTKIISYIDCVCKIH